MIHKPCSTCGELKPLESFAHSRRAKDGRFCICKPCNYQRSLAWRHKNKEKNSRTVKLWKLRNRAKINAQTRERRCRDADKIIAQRKQHYKKHATYYRTWAAWKKEIIKRQTPLWANRQDIQKIYAERDQLNQSAGFIKFHVDHVIPLQGKTVCGLHITNNLQIIEATINIRKKNHYQEVV